MEIIVGKTAGFCYGVKNATDKTMQILEENRENKVYCFFSACNFIDVYFYGT